MDALNFGVFQSQISELAAQLQKEKQTYKNDLINGSSSANGIFGGSAINSGTLVSATASSQKHPGTATIRSALNTANSGYRFGTNYKIMILGGGESGRIVFSSYVLSDTVSIFGFNDSNDNTNPSNGVYFKLLNGAVKGCAAKNGTTSETGTSFALAEGVYYQFAIDINANFSTAAFKIYDDDGNLLWNDALSANMPTNNNIGFSINAWTTASAEAKTLIILDYIEFSLPKVRVIL